MMSISTEYWYSSMEVVARLLKFLVEWLLHPLVQHAAAAAASSGGSSRTTTSVSAQAVRKGLHVAAYGEEEEGATCAVCLSEVHGEDRVWELRNCRHVFHERCLDRWMDHDERVSCPLCRAPLMTRVQLARGDGEFVASQPSWAVDRLLYLFADDQLLLT